MRCRASLLCDLTEFFCKRFITLKRQVVLALAQVLNVIAELGKLMCNAMLAQRVSAVNSITALCE